MKKYKFTVNIDGKDIEVWKIDHDTSGNPRYVIHFLALAQPDHEKNGMDAVSLSYNAAAQKIKSIGGRKYNAKWYGGGLVFSSYNLEDDLKHAMKA